MMKRLMSLVVCGVVLLLLLGSTVLAQTTSPRITSFGTAAGFVNRSELVNRTARVPLAWTTEARPIGANLIFEQVLPDGTFVNVELPRRFFWVSSNGEGVAAPLLPDDASEVVLRMRLMNVFDGTEYDRRLVSLPIRNDGAPIDNSTAPRLVSFTTENRALDRQALINRTERVEVGWESANRPFTATLVFEQVFADGTSANVELPRENAWVNPSGSGVVAPYITDPNTNTVTLRVRMIDVRNRFTYDQRTVTLAIAGAVITDPVAITTFSAGASSIRTADLAERQLILPVSWGVANRPDGSNLAFEQILPDGSVVNVELPRDFQIIPSSGEGFVRPYPVGNAAEVVLQLRVFDVQTTQTLAQQRVQIPTLAGGTQQIIVVEGDACYQTPFLPGFGIETGDTVEARASLTLRSTSGVSGTTTATAASGEQLTVADGPYCYQNAGDAADGSGVRQWQVRKADGVSGWTEEYSGTATNYTQLIVPAGDGTTTTDTTDGDTVAAAGDTSGGTVVDSSADAADDTIAINSFAVSPNPAQRFGTVTVSWQVSGAYDRIDVGWYPSQLWLGDTYRESLYTGRASSSSVQVELDSMQVDDVRFVVDVFTGDGAVAATQDVSLDLTCAASLSFTDPENADECALPELQVNAAYQSFENGFMLWRDDVDWIVVGFDDGTYRVYDDQWTGQSYPVDTAPAGLITPERGFGYLWVNNPEARNRLGWADADEISFTMKTQQLDKRGSRGTLVGEWYYALPGGRDIRTQYSTTGSWREL